MSIWTDPKFQERVRQALIKASEFMEAEAECFKESGTLPDGTWVDHQEADAYEREMKQVDEMADLLKQISEGGK